MIAPIPLELQELVDFESNITRKRVENPQIEIVGDYTNLRNLSKSYINISSGGNTYKVKLLYV